MTAGNQYNSASINSQAAQAIMGVRDALIYAWKQYEWLDQLGAQGIQDAPAAPGDVQISEPDAETILSALADVAGVYQFVNNLPVTLGYGAAKVTGTVDLMTFGRQLTNGQ